MFPFEISFFSKKKSTFFSFEVFGILPMIESLKEGP